MRTLRFVDKNRRSGYLAMMQPIRWIPVLTLVVLSSSCIGDKTEEDYRREQVRMYLAKIQAIEGVYNGGVNSLQDNLSLGAFSLKISPTTKGQNSKDNLSTEPRSMVHGEITYTRAFSNQISFEEADYDDVTGVFSASVPVQDDAGRVAHLELRGRIGGGAFSGTIEAEGYPSYGGSVSLVKNGPVSTGQGLVSSMSSRLEALGRTETDKYTGSYTHHGVLSTFTMNLSYSDSHISTQLLNLFRPVRPVRVETHYADRDITYTNAQIDDRAGILKGETLVASEGAIYNSSLECHADHPGGIVEKWDCRINKFNISLAAVPKASP